MENIRDAAQKNAEVVVNPFWKRAYLDLAYAADRIAAMSIRTQNSVQKPIQKGRPHDLIGDRKMIEMEVTFEQKKKRLQKFYDEWVKPMKGIMPFDLLVASENMVKKYSLTR